MRNAICPYCKSDAYCQSADIYWVHVDTCAANHLRKEVVNALENNDPFTDYLKAKFKKDKDDPK